MPTDFERITANGIAYIAENITPNLSGSDPSKQKALLNRFIQACPTYPEAFLAYKFSGHVILIWIENSKIANHAIIAVNDTKLHHEKYYTVVEGYDHIANNFMSYVREVPLNTTL